MQTMIAYNDEKRALLIPIPTARVENLFRWREKRCSSFSIAEREDDVICSIKATEDIQCSRAHVVMSLSILRICQIYSTQQRMIRACAPGIEMLLHVLFRLEKTAGLQIALKCTCGVHRDLSFGPIKRFLALAGLCNVESNNNLVICLCQIFCVKN